MAEEKNLTPAEELKNNIDQSIEAKAAEVSAANNEAIEAKAAELNSAIEAKASTEMVETLEKELNELKNNFNSKSVDSTYNKKAAQIEEFNSKMSDAMASVLKSGAGKIEMDLKTFVAGTSSNTLVPSMYDQTGKIAHDPTYKTQLRDVVMSRPGVGGSIIWNRETGETDASGAKAFGAQAAETSKTLTRQESTFRTLTNYYTVPVEYFEDIEGFSSYIQNRLMSQLMDEESNQILTGDGTGDDYNGINTFASNLSPVNTTSLAAARTAQDTALGSWANSVNDANRHDAIVAVCSLLEEANFTPGCVILNPFDYNQLVLIKDNEGQYVLHQALDQNSGKMRSYLATGVEVIKHNAQTADYFTVFDKSSLEYVMRDSIELDFDYSGDNFRRKQVAIMASLRGNMADWLPDGAYYAKFNDDDTSGAHIAGVINGLETP